MAVKYAAAQNAGDLNVVVVGWNDSTSAINSVTDSKGNTYPAAVGPTTQSGNATQVIYYASNIAAAAAGANTVTVTFNTTVKYPDVRIVEYSGIATSGALDVAVGASGSSATPSSGPLTTTNASDLLVAGNYIASNFLRVGAGYTLRVDTSPDDDIVEDQIVAATGSYSASSTQTVANWWVMQLAAFRAAGSGSADTTPPSAPASLTATAASSTQINLAWSASTDNVGVTGYLDRALPGHRLFKLRADRHLGHGHLQRHRPHRRHRYSYRVRATDAAGNLSGYSATADRQHQQRCRHHAAERAERAHGDQRLGQPDQSRLERLHRQRRGHGLSDRALPGHRLYKLRADRHLGHGHLQRHRPDRRHRYSYRVRATDAAGNLSGYSGTASRRDQQRCRHHAAERPERAHGDQRLDQPDQSRLERLDRQRRGHGLSDRALPGHRVHELRAGRHLDHDELQRHRPHGRDPLQLSRARHRCGREPQCLLGHRQCDHRQRRVRRRLPMCRVRSRIRARPVRSPWSMRQRRARGI